MQLGMALFKSKADGKVSNEATGTKTWKIPQGITTIAFESHKDCQSLERVDMSQAFRLKTIDGSAFRNCKSLVMLDFRHTIVETIHENTFRECISLRKILLNAELSEIASNAFAHCSALQTIAFHHSGRLKTICSDAFAYCASLHTLEFPSSLESIDCGAFSFCKDLTSVQLQQGLICVAEDAFLDCESLTDVTIPSSVDYFMENSFDGEYLERIDIQGDRLELAIRLSRMYPNAFVGLSEEKWRFLYCHDDKNFCSVMTKKDLEKLDLVKGLVANKLYTLIHWSISVVGPIGT